MTKYQGGSTMYEISGSRECEPLLVSLSSYDGPVMVKRKAACDKNTTITEEAPDHHGTMFRERPDEVRRTF